MRDRQLFHVSRKGFGAKLQRFNRKVVPLSKWVLRLVSSLPISLAAAPSPISTGGCDKKNPHPISEEYAHPHSAEFLVCTKKRNYSVSCLHGRRAERS